MKAFISSNKSIFSDKEWEKIKNKFEINYNSYLYFLFSLFLIVKNQFFLFKKKQKLNHSFNLEFNKLHTIIWKHCNQHDLINCRAKLTRNWNSKILQTSIAKHQRKYKYLNT